MSDSGESRQTRRYVGAGATILWMLLLIFLGLVPATQAAFNAMAKINEARNIEESLEANMGRINTAISMYEEQIPNIDLVDQALPGSPKALTFINELDVAIAAYDLVPEILDYDSGAVLAKQVGKLKAGTVKGSALPMNFKLRVRGNYEQIRNFVSHLESMPRVVGITEITILRLDEAERERLEGNQVQKNLRLSLTGEFYYQPAEDG